MVHFTQDWFSIAIPGWEAHVVPNLKDKPSLMLEVGSFEGRSAIWSLQNFLNHPDSRIICCDMFGDFFNYKGDELLNVFKDNTKEYSDKIIIHRGPSQETLKQEALWKNYFEKVDFGYIDGGHSSKEALVDAVLLWPLIKPGGYMCFDDYFGGDIRSIDSCHIGINHFLQVYQDELDIVHRQYQVIVKKREIKMHKI